MTLWEHIKESNPRYVGILLAELQHIEKTQGKKWLNIVKWSYPRHILYLYKQMDPK